MFSITTSFLSKKIINRGDFFERDKSRTTLTTLVSASPACSWRSYSHHGLGGKNIFNDEYQNKKHRQVFAGVFIFVNNDVISNRDASRDLHGWP